MQVFVIHLSKLAVLRKVAEQAYKEAAERVIIALGQFNAHKLVNLVKVGHAVNGVGVFIHA